MNGLQRDIERTIGPLVRWKEDGIEQPGWSEISSESPSFKALWTQWDSLHAENGCLREPGGVRMEGMSLCSWWFRILESRNYFERCTMGILVVILESRRHFPKLRRASTGSVAGKTSRAGARGVGPVWRLKDRKLGRDGRSRHSRSPSSDRRREQVNEKGQFAKCCTPRIEGNSVGYQAGDFVWLYDPRRRKGRCPKLSPD